MSEAVSKKEFGSWITALRDSSGSGTQEEAAKRIGVSRIQLARWENGVSYPHPSKFQGIVDAYHIDVREILSRMGQGQSRESVSDWTMALARRIERRTSGLSPAKRATVERAFDSILSVAAEQ